ncbi:MAG: dihydropteroate synthase [Alistipes ihumii]
MKLTVGKHRSTSRPVVMTIINATPDSFYEGSRMGRRCRAQGRRAVTTARPFSTWAAIVRPGADNVTPDEELRRVTLALKRSAACPDTPVSIDTTVPVAEGAIERFAV